MKHARDDLLTHSSESAECWRMSKRQMCLVGGTGMELEMLVGSYPSRYPNSKAKPRGHPSAVSTRFQRRIDENIPM